MVPDNLIWCKEEFLEWGVTGKGSPGKKLCHLSSRWGSDTPVPKRVGTCLEADIGGLTLPHTATSGTDPVILKSILHSNSIISTPGRLSLECIEWTLSWLELVDWLGFNTFLFRRQICFLWGWKAAEVSPLGDTASWNGTRFSFYSTHTWQVIPPNSHLQRIAWTLFSFHFYYLYLLQKI